MIRRYYVPAIALAIATTLLFAGCTEEGTTVTDIQQNPHEWVLEYSSYDDPAVIELVDSLGNGDDTLSTSEVYAMQRWVSSNIKYSLEDPTLPSETLQKGRGSCWSSTSLLYSMFLAESASADVYVLLIDVTSGGEAIKHCAVLTKFGNSIIISDPTIDSYAIDNVCTLASPQNAVQLVLDNTNVDTYQVTTAVCTCCSQTFNSNEEFYVWV